MLWSEKVKEIMVQRQISQKELSQKSGITEASVSRYLHGDRTPRMDIILNFARALGVTTEYLLEDEQKNTQTPYEAISEAIARNGGKLTDKEKTQLITILLGKGE